MSTIGEVRQSSVHRLVNRSDEFGRHMHVQATFSFGEAACAQATLEVFKSPSVFYLIAHCGAVTANLGVLFGLPGRRIRSVLGDRRAETTAVPMPRTRNGASLAVDVYVDSVVVEVFAGGAHVVRQSP